MARKKADCQNIMVDIIDACCNTLHRNTAVKGIRNLCRYFGGDMYYIPVKKKTGRVIEEMYKLLCETIGAKNANIILNKTMSLYGGLQIYIPFERTVFEAEIAEEIYRRYTDENVSISEMFREYGISFTKAYQLWKIGRRIKLNKEIKK